MGLTTIIVGHAGVGKSPLDYLFKKEVIRIEPYRVREAPRNPKDVYYSSQQVRDTLKLLCSNGVIEVIGNIEIHPLATFFKVRTDDQFLLTPKKPCGDQPYKVEIYAPVLLRLLDSLSARQLLPFLVGGKENSVLVLILNSCSNKLKNKAFKDSELESKTRIAVKCRHKLMETSDEKVTIDVNKRIRSLKEELPAWKGLNKISLLKFAVVDVNEWQYLEYTYCAKPVDGLDKLKPIPVSNLLQHQKKWLRAAKRKILESVQDKVGKKRSDMLEKCLLSEKDINNIDDLIVKYKKQS